MKHQTFIIKNFLRITDPDIHYRRMTYPPEREDWIIDLNVAIKTCGPEYKKAMQAVRNRIP